MVVIIPPCLVSSNIPLNYTPLLRKTLISSQPLFIQHQQTFHFKQFRNIFNLIYHKSNYVQIEIHFKGPETVYKIKNTSVPQYRSETYGVCLHKISPKVNEVHVRGTVTEIPFEYIALHIAIKIFIKREKNHNLFFEN